MHQRLILGVWGFVRIIRNKLFHAYVPCISVTCNILKTQQEHQWPKYNSSHRTPAELSGLLCMYVCVCVLADVAHITQRISCVCLWIKGFKSVCGQSVVSSDSVQSKKDRKTQRQMHSKIACVQIRKL